MTKAREIMTGGAECVGENETLEAAAKKMKELNVGSLPICGEDNRLKGMVTDRDIVVRVVAEGVSLDAPVSQIMSDEVQACHDEDNLAEAIAKMGYHQVRRLVVLNGAGRLTGILSLGDVALDYGAKAVGKTLEEISAEPAAAH